jgi:6-pyruvoyltetrahydropterin/6-carboxytetrahydropterin synthase
MFEVKVISEFSAAHNLRGYRGKCEKLHGHNWKTEVVVASQRLGKADMVVDFKRLKTCLAKVLQKLDHRYLNAIAYFKKLNPTSENIARYIYDNLKLHIVGIKSVSVWESNSSCATYYVGD